MKKSQAKMELFFGEKETFFGKFLSKTNATREIIQKLSLSLT